MDSKLAVDRAGRVMIPKALRDELLLCPGDGMERKIVGKEIRLRPVRTNALLKKQQGVWVYSGHASEASSVTDLIDRERERRLRELRA